MKRMCDFKRKKSLDWDSKLPLAGLCLAFLIVGATGRSICYKRNNIPGVPTDTIEEIERCGEPSFRITPSVDLAADLGLETTAVVLLKVDNAGLSVMHGQNGSCLEEVSKDSIAANMAGLTLRKLFYATKGLGQMADLSDIELPKEVMEIWNWTMDGHVLHFICKDGKWTYCIKKEGGSNGVEGYNGGITDSTKNSKNSYQKFSKIKSNKTLISLFSITSSVDPLAEFGLDAKVVELTANKSGLSVKYGEDECSFKDLARDSGVDSTVRLMLRELFLATKGLKKPGQRVDLSRVELPENAANIWNFTLDSREFIFHYENMEWWFAVKEKVGSTEEHSESRLEHGIDDQPTSRGRLPIQTMLLFYIDPSEDTLSYLGLNTSIVQVKFDGAVLTIKYGQDDCSLISAKQNSFTLSTVRSALAELYLATKGLEVPNQKIDLSDVVLPDVVDNKWDWIPDIPYFLFSHKDGRWTFTTMERRTFNEVNGSSEEQFFDQTNQITEKAAA